MRSRAAQTVHPLGVHSSRNSRDCSNRADRAAISSRLCGFNLGHPTTLVSRVSYTLCSPYANRCDRGGLVSCGTPCTDPVVIAPHASGEFRDHRVHSVNAVRESSSLITLISCVGLSQPLQSIVQSARPSGSEKGFDNSLSSCRSDGVLQELEYLARTDSKSPILRPVRSPRVGHKTQTTQSDSFRGLFSPRNPRAQCSSPLVKPAHAARATLASQIT